MIDGILQGLTTLTDPTNLLLLAIGCLVGTLIGMLPGLGPISAIALMIPMTYTLPASSAMILLAAVYYGAMFGGSTSSILINAPGEAGTVAATFDGHPLARSGQAGKALAVAAYGSFIGGTIAALLLMLVAPLLATVALSFQSPDYFALMVLGLTGIAAFSRPGRFLKAMMMTVLGLMLATVGQDVSSDAIRFTFGNLDLIDGISFLLLAMATFAVTEAVMIVLRSEHLTDGLKHTPIRGYKWWKLQKDEVRDLAPVMGRSSIVGFMIGVLPGAGGTVASFLAYAMERNLASPREKERFGQGSLRGLCAPETANNAAATGSFVPLLTLGIPGSGTTAVLLGALISYGIQPGPRMLTERPDVFWAVVISMYLGNVFLLILNLPLVPYLAKLLDLPGRLLVPLILFFSLLGVYLVSFNTFDLFLMIGLAVVTVVLRLLDYPMAPLILAFVLGRLIEENLRRSLVLYNGSMAFLWERPLTLAITLLTVATFLTPLIRLRRKPPVGGEAVT